MTGQRDGDDEAEAMPADNTTTAQHDRNHTTATSAGHRDAERTDRVSLDAPTSFEADCRAIATAMEKTGARLRVALTTDGNAEPFLISARYAIRSRMQVHRQTEAERTIDRALAPESGSCREFLDEAARRGRLLAKPDTPRPIVWNEPALVIAGIAPGTVALWRERRAEAESEAENGGETEP